MEAIWFIIGVGIILIGAPLAYLVISDRDVAVEFEEWDNGE